MLRKSSVFLVLLGLAPAAAGAQNEEPAVRSAIQEVFDGMRAGDSAVVRSRLADGVLLNRVGERDGVPVLSSRKQPVP